MSDEIKKMNYQMKWQKWENLSPCFQLLEISNGWIVFDISFDSKIDRSSMYCKDLPEANEYIKKRKEEAAKLDKDGNDVR